MESPAGSSGSSRGPVQVVVATTVFLSFISLWRAVAIVLADLGSSAFYAAGIAEQAVGEAAPWFILGVLLFSFAVRAIYTEGSIMFVRGGAYRVVRSALGGTMGKLSVSALLFDYVLTGPISAVSAGHYIAGLFNDVAGRAGYALALPRNETSAIIALLVIAYFWRRNTQGIRDASSDALRIIQLTTVMVVMLLGWAAVTLFVRGGQLPPPPSPEHLRFSPEALGWLEGTALPSVTAVALLVGFGHSFLAMSGWESLAQVYREIEHPKPQNLRRAGLAVFAYSLVFTGSVSFAAVALIPDPVRPHFADNLISGLAMNLAGPAALLLAFQAFVVLVGFLVLSGAVNTSIVAANAILNRVSEDRVLSDWFRKPQRRYGTTYRILNAIAILQVATVLLARGNVYLLGEAYAFGVVWSFALNALALLVLRFKDRSPREWRVPLNVRIGGTELPVGLGMIGLLLFAVALTNLVTKQLATLAGVGFTALLFAVFTVSERQAERRRRRTESRLDQFQLLPAPEVGLNEVAARPASVLVPVRDYNSLRHVRWALDRTDTEKRDVIVMTVRLLRAPDTRLENLQEADLFLDYEQVLFTAVVGAAERQGKPVKLLVVPSANVFDAVAQTAVRLGSSEIVVGESAALTAANQARLLGEAWERVPGSEKLRTRLTVCRQDGGIETFMLGPHLPTLTTEDLELIHRLWVQAVGPVGIELHHRDIVRAALEDFERRLSGKERDRILTAIRKRPERGDRQSNR